MNFIDLANLRPFREITVEESSNSRFRRSFQSFSSCYHGSLQTHTSQLDFKASALKSLKIRTLIMAGMKIEPQMAARCAICKMRSSQPNALLIRQIKRLAPEWFRIVCSPKFLSLKSFLFVSSSFHRTLSTENFALKLSVWKLWTKTWLRFRNSDGPIFNKPTNLQTNLHFLDSNAIFKFQSISGKLPLSSKGLQSKCLLTQQSWASPPCWIITRAQTAVWNFQMNWDVWVSNFENLQLRWSALTNRPKYLQQADHYTDWIKFDYKTHFN